MFRLGIWVALFATIVLVRWVPEPPNDDALVWATAIEVAESGADPYNRESLNSALGSPEGIEVALFNPPSWLISFKLLGGNASVMNALGLVMMAGSLWWLTRKQAVIEVAALAVGVFLFLISSISRTTLMLGQTGFLMAGLIGLALCFRQTKFAGAIISILTFKPHVAGVLGLVEFRRQPFGFLKSFVIGGLLLVVSSSLIFGADIWANYLQSIFDVAKPLSLDDMTVQTLTRRFVMPSGVSGGLAIAGLVASSWIALRLGGTGSMKVSLLCLAVVLLFSGHAFAHDWIWLVFIPVVCGWKGPLTAAIGASAGFVHSAGLQADLDLAPVLISWQSVLALAATGYLARAVWVEREVSRN